MIKIALMVKRGTGCESIKETFYKVKGFYKDKGAF